MFAFCSHRLQLVVHSDKPEWRVAPYLRSLSALSTLTHLPRNSRSADRPSPQPPYQQPFINRRPSSTNPSPSLSNAIFLSLSPGPPRPAPVLTPRPLDTPCARRACWLRQPQRVSGARRRRQAPAEAAAQDPRDVPRPHARGRGGVCVLRARRGERRRGLAAGGAGGGGGG